MLARIRKAAASPVDATPLLSAKGDRLEGGDGMSA
jgi:hypothetical protein